jgi:diguanylate cyclase (GGDEF)-like protein/PAS domain S-box-containing protein
VVTMEKRVAIPNSKYAIFWADPKTGLILNCNKTAEALLERKKRDIIGSHQRTLHPPEKADYYTNMWNTHAEDDGAPDLEAEVITSSEKVKPVHIFASMTLVDGKLVVQGIFDDISDHNKAAEALEVSEIRYRRLFETAKDGIIILNAESGAIDDINPFLEEMLGYSRESLVGKKLWQIGPMKDTEKCKKAFLELQNTEYIRYENLPLETKDGRLIEVEFVSNVYTIDHTKVIQCNIRDITKRRLAERAADDAREFAESIVSTLREPMLVLSADLRVVKANRSFYKVFEVTPEETEGRPIYQLGNQQWNIPELRALLGEIVDKNTDFDDFEVEYEFPSIGRRTMLLNARKVHKAMSKTEAILLAIEDITERKKIQKALQESKERFEYKSYHDGLTGLYNRSYFSEQMAHLGKDLARSAPLSIISIDIDGLKIINDTFGHKVGDDMLISAATIISACFREVDSVARTGGDEFSVILPGVDRKAVLEKKSRISKQVDAFNSGTPAVPINMSIGVATSIDVGKETIYDIYQRADENMYQYKLIQAKSQKSKVIDMLLAALSERDFVAQGHAERLSEMSELISSRLRLQDDRRKNLVLLAKVHDIGKVGIPDNILFKPRRLSEEETQKMKEHVQIGHGLASRSQELFHVADLILHHHEFWDGKGYTAGLKGEQIPLECRIFSIMDAYDAMTNTRPYRKGMGKKQAIKELRRCSGTQFEPGLVDEFIRFVEHKKPGVSPVL